MSENKIHERLIKICGPKNVSKDPAQLQEFAKDNSYVEGKAPNFIVSPSKTVEVEHIIKAANSMGFSVIPVSSSSEIRRHGDTVPKKDNAIILDLSKMKKIINIDEKNRVVMIEPGVTFGELIPKLKKKGVRLLLPLLPDDNKSAAVCALDREPITIPRYHWDSSDPLLCTEVVFGTGDLFRTGTAAGPGDVKQQIKSGQAQLNPMGPTQFSPFRIIQASQGSIGVVTWVTLKLELIPTLQKIVHLQSENLQELLDLQHELIKYRLCDEVLILNDLSLSCLTEANSNTIDKLANTFSKWNLIYVMAGRGRLAQDKLDYLEGDIKEIISDLKLEKLTSITAINTHDILDALKNSTPNPWRNRYKGGCQDIFFLSSIQKIPELVATVESKFTQDLGIYIQATNQGTSYHCEFDIFHAPSEKDALKNKYLELSTALMDQGAFFNRPYGLLADAVYERHDESTTIALKKVKKIFDPKNVLNPGVLCFNDE